MELIAGFAAVIFISSLITYFIILLWSRSSFDDLVKANDVETAALYAESLGGFYENEQSWENVGDALGNIHIRDDELFKEPDRYDDHRHPREGEVPIVILDSRGEVVYSGISFKNPSETVDSLSLKPAKGEKIMADGKVVGSVFFKSMLFRSYNPQERVFLLSLAKSLGLSVSIGLILSLFLGSLLAARFTRPIILLENAVRKISRGEKDPRVVINRKDEIGSLAVSFNRMTEQLRITEEARQNLLADIAHELRTPVSILQANLEMIQEGVYRADDEKLKSLYKETVLMSSLIKDLRSLSDLEVGIAAMKCEPFELTNFIRETCGKYLPLFEEKHVSLTLSMGNSLTVSADEDKIRQVLGNLLGNALKYAPENSEVRVSTREFKDDSGEDFVRITVEDHGSGIPEESREKIFERFYRVDQSRSRHSGGRGLGLAISRKIIEISRGSMGAENREPHGLKVWFTLPVNRP